MITIQQINKIHRNITSFDRFHEIVMTMKKPCISIDEDYGYLKVNAWNANGVCFYHFIDNNYYPPTTYVNKLREVARLI